MRFERNFPSFSYSRCVLLALLVVAGILAVPGEVRGQWTQAGSTVYYNGGPVGIGTATPNYQVHINSGNGIVFNKGTVATAYGAIGVENNVAGHSVFMLAAGNTYAGTMFGIPAADSGQLYTNNMPFAIGPYGAYNLTLGTNNAARMTITSAGKVGIGTASPSEVLHVVGNIHVSGNINAKYQDVAEWVPATHELSPGTVVVLDSELPNTVRPSSRPYDVSVAGVVSSQPGLTLGESADNKEMIATTGRVRVRVDATRMPIRIGDLVVTSSKPGMAMRSEPVEFQGRTFHQPGTIIGKALEPLKEGEGEILVLLSLQ
jgi:hypothetical protein